MNKKTLTSIGARFCRLSAWQATINPGNSPGLAGSTMKMKKNGSITGKIKSTLTALAMLALVTLNSELSTARAQGTAFTYQGQLMLNGSPAASGNYLMNFTLFDNVNATGTSYPLINPAGPLTVPVNDGLFSVMLNFGPDVFGPNTFAGNVATPFWVQIQVAPAGGALTTLAPLQEVTPAPYSIYAETSGASSNLLGTLPVGQLSGTLANSQLSDSSITVNIGSGLSGGGTVSLGGTLNLGNTGVLSLASETPDITASMADGMVTLNDTATSANTDSTLVKRDGTGSFSAGNLTLYGTLTLYPPSGTEIIYAGYGGLLMYDDYNGNSFSGLGSGNTTMFGLGAFWNTVTGQSALVKNTTGGLNTANGYEALYSNTTGAENTANGGDALYANTTGANNTAHGAYALYANTTGGVNTASGSYALYNNTTGNWNTAMGGDALENNTTGLENTAMGGNALSLNTNGAFNTANGYQALYANTIGSNNTASGFAALEANTTGQQNTALGNSALSQNISGSGNIALGAFAGFDAMGSENIDIGNLGAAADNYIIRLGQNQTNTFVAGIYGTTLPASSLFVVADSSGQLGTISTIPTNSLPVIPSGDLPGYGALTIVTGAGLSGGGLVPLGGSLTLANTGVISITGNADITVSSSTGTLTLGDTATSADTSSTIVKRDSSGDFAATTITLNGATSQLNLPQTSSSPDIILSGNQLFIYGDNHTNFFSGQLAGNTALGGYSVLSGIQNTGSGVGALYSITSGSQNTALGAAALNSNTNGSANTAIGFQVLYGNQSGGDNTACGFQALYNNLTGSLNTASGFHSLYENTSGSDNSAYGRASLYGNTVGSYNTAAGDYAMNNNTSGSNNIAMGYQAGYNLTTGNYNIDIGNSGVAGDNNIIRIGSSQTATYLVGTVYANGVALTSDRNAKENFKPVDHQAVLAKVADLPVTEWNYKTDSAGVQHIGPMAQDFQAAFGLDGADDKHISVVDEGGVALAAIQGLNEKLEAQLKDKDAQIQSLEERLERIENLVSAKTSHP